MENTFKVEFCKLKEVTKLKYLTTIIIKKNYVHAKGDKLMNQCYFALRLIQVKTTLDK